MIETQLVIVHEGKIVTDSLTVAEVFEKEHKRVLQDVRDLECSEEFSQHNFVLSTYTTERGRDYPKYFITQDGFTLLAMGYTGKTAMEFKEKYIAEFNRMKEHLNKPKQLTEREQLLASMKLTIEMSEEVNTIKSDVEMLKHRVDEHITLTHGEQSALQAAVKRRVEKLWGDGINGTLESKAQMYSRIHSQLKRGFEVPSYRVVRRKDYDEAKQWVNSWRPM